MFMVIFYPFLVILRKQINIYPELKNKHIFFQQNQVICFQKTSYVVFSVLDLITRIKKPFFLKLK